MWCDLLCCNALKFITYVIIPTRFFGKVLGFFATQNVAGLRSAGNTTFVGMITILLANPGN